MSTLKEVAKRAEVSITTVSLYLNGKSAGRISKETKERIADAINELKYQPNLAAKKLRSKDFNNQAYTIAIFWASDYRRYLLGTFMSGIQTALLKSNLDFDLIIRPYNTNELYKQKKALNSNMYHAAIIANASVSDMQYLESIKPIIPIILLNRNSEQYHFISVNNRAIGERAAELILEKGFKSAAIFNTTNAYLAINERMKGFIDACRNYKIELPYDYQIYSDNSFEGGIQAANDYLNCKSLSPSVIFSASDRIALGALYEFHHHEIKIPEKISILSVSIEQTSDTQYSFPPLSIINIPLSKMAEASIILVDKILKENITQPQHIELPFDVCLRESF